MKLKKLLFAMATAVFALGATSTVYAATEEEDNSTPATATKINVNEDVIGNLSDYGDADWYVFTTDEVGMLYVTLGPDDTVDNGNIGYGWTIDVYDKDRNEIYSNEWKGTYRTRYISWNPGEKLYIKVSSVYNYSERWDDENYKLKITYEKGLWESEYNDTKNTSDEIKSGKTYSGTLYNKYDVDWYKVDITKQGLFNVVFGVDDMTDTSNMKYGWTYEVYDSDMNNIYSYSQITKNTEGRKLPYKVGTYYIKVYSAGGTYSTDCIDIIYNLTVNNESDKYWEIENNDEQKNATLMTVNKQYKGYLTEKYGVDWYKFKLTDKGVIKLDFQMDEETNFEDVHKGWKVYLYKTSDSTPIATFTGVTASDEITKTLGKGTYYVKVCASDTYAYANYAPVQCLYDLKVSYTATPAAPTKLTVTAGTKKATLKWGAVKNATSYVVYRSDKKDGKYTKVATVKSGTSYTDSKLTAKKTYYYKVVAATTKNGVTASSAASEIKSVTVK